MKSIDMLKEIKSVLGIELSDTKEIVEEIKLEQQKLENGTVLEADAFESGNGVFIVTEDERVALPIGEYELEDGKILKVEEEGIISEISEVSNEEEEVKEEEELKEEDIYATKEELAEIKSMVEEIKEMMKPKEEDLAEQEELMSQKMTELACQEDEALKEELSKPASEPLKHSPESKEELNKIVYGNKRPMNTKDRVLQRIANL